MLDSEIGSRVRSSIKHLHLLPSGVTQAEHQAILEGSAEGETGERSSEARFALQHIYPHSQRHMQALSDLLDKHGRDGQQVFPALERLTIGHTGGRFITAHETHSLSAWPSTKLMDVEDSKMRLMGAYEEANLPPWARTDQRPSAWLSGYQADAANIVRKLIAAAGDAQVLVEATSLNSDLPQPVGAPIIRQGDGGTQRPICVLGNGVTANAAGTDHFRQYPLLVADDSPAPTYHSWCSEDGKHTIEQMATAAKEHDTRGLLREHGYKVHFKVREPRPRMPLDETTLPPPVKWAERIRTISNNTIMDSEKVPLPILELVRTLQNTAEEEEEGERPIQFEVSWSRMTDAQHVASAHEFRNVY